MLAKSRRVELTDGSAHVRFSESLGFGQCLITPDGMVFTSDWVETKVSVLALLLRP